MFKHLAILICKRLCYCSCGSLWGDRMTDRTLSSSSTNSEKGLGSFVPHRNRIPKARGASYPVQGRATGRLVCIVLPLLANFGLFRPCIEPFLVSFRDFISAC